MGMCKRGRLGEGGRGEVRHLQRCEGDGYGAGSLLERIVVSRNQLARIGCQRRQDERNVEGRDAGAVTNGAHDVHNRVCGGTVFIGDLVYKSEERTTHYGTR